jgi:CO/xanthine dehydrogenase FAD-binding subunit
MAIFYRRLPRFTYIRPRTVEEALSLLDEHRETAKLLAGGTDLLPQLKGRQVDLPRYVIDLKGIAGLDGVTYDDRTGLTIGALATMSAIAESAVLRDLCPLLIQTALCMASPQVRNRGTFAGNICSAIPSADSAPSLLALEARVRLKGRRGERIVALDQFFTGPRKTVIGPDEILTSIEVPEPAPASRNVYLKLSPRHAMDLAVVGVAVTGTSREGVCEDVRIAVGAVAPTPLRAPVAEALLRGQKITAEIIDEAARNTVTQCDPIDDHRASREYRCDMVHVMTRRALSQVFLGEKTKG